MKIIDDALPAFEVPIQDRDMRLYMQAEVLAGGHHHERFRRAIEEFRTNFRKRWHPAIPNLGEIIELDEAAAAIGSDFKAAASFYLNQLPYAQADFSSLFDDYGWKLQQLPDDRSRVLSVGCGGGAELVFLRARFPGAKITALDYEMTIAGGARALELLNVEFRPGDIFESARTLQAEGSRFDLIFSNHVIEHFFEPNRAIAELAQVLGSGGIFSAGVPLDAYPFADLLEKLSAEPAAVHGLDLNWLDVRHPWKTNEADLAATLLESGLADVVLYRRTRHANNSKAAVGLSLDECRRRESRARALYGVLIQPAIGTLKLLFGRNPPRRLARLVFALDRRLWFGRYQLKCDIQPEVFATAIRRR